MTIDFVYKIDFDYGVSKDVSPLIRRVVARNPSAFTFHGTGTYIVGHEEVAIVDPGPDLPEHLDALYQTVKNEKVTHILITHTHQDHSAATTKLQEITGAPTYGFGPHASNYLENDSRVEEGADYSFKPDYQLIDNSFVEGPGWSLEALHTPGHCSNHLCFLLHQEKSLLSGDHVMGWSTTVISPPDGNMLHYMQSLRKLLKFDIATYWPTHGPPIVEPKIFVKELIAHRKKREEDIMLCLESGQKSIEEFVSILYKDIDPALRPAAGRSVLAHLLHLIEKNKVSSNSTPNLYSKYQIT